MYVANISFEEEKLTEIEKEYLKKYAGYMDEIPAADDGEIEQLYKKVVEGDEEAQARLVTIYMKLVVGEAKKMKQSEVFLGDLIQAGNIGIILGLERITDEKTAHEVIMKHVRESMREEKGK